MMASVPGGRKAGAWFSAIVMRRLGTVGRQRFRTPRSCVMTACSTCACHFRNYSTKPAKDDIAINGVNNGTHTDYLSHHPDSPTLTQHQDMASKMELIDSSVTIFLKPSKSTIELHLVDKLQNKEMIPKVKDIVNLGFRHRLRDKLKEISKRKPDTRPEEQIVEPGMTSTDELVWKEQKIIVSDILKNYAMLSKIRLTGLVVVTAMAGYAVAPGVFDPAVFTCCTVGTMLTSCAANATNQFFEVPYDSQMNRTKNRVLVRGILSPLHAVGFAFGASACGLTLLYCGVNPITAGLGAFNLFLYTLVYTPMKRLHVANTWVGSVVGAIPPMMGWTAATGALDPGAWLLGAILYAWQFPHFKALSWNLRSDYSRGGYRMSAVVNPNLCKRVAFRYCVGMIGLCTLAPVLDVTTWTFAADSLPLNLYLAYLGYRFYRDGDSKSSRKLFRFSLVHIPALLILMLISKKSYGAQKQLTMVTEGKEVITSSIAMSNVNQR